MPSVVVPVVFHVVHNTLSENISEAQILSQLDILNQDFGDSMRMDNIWPQAADIEFCLLPEIPKESTDGIVVWRRMSRCWSQHAKFASRWFGCLAGVGYLNIWIYDLGRFVGLCSIPGHGAGESDGVVCNYLAVGNVGTATFPFHLGRRPARDWTLSRALSHWGDGGARWTILCWTRPTQMVRIWLARLIELR